MPASDSNAQTSSDPILGNSDIAVIYFSQTSHTRPLAEYAQEHLDASLYEIAPTIPYTEADIDYNDPNSRANKEQNDNEARPKINALDIDMSRFSTVLLGYPIWWGQAPKVMYTMLESYDFADKTILPFCTSGSSPIGSSATNLAKSAPYANWLEGKRFAIGTDKSTFTSWLDERIQKNS